MLPPIVMFGLVRPTPTLPTVHLTLHLDASRNTDLWQTNTAGVLTTHPGDAGTVSYWDDVEHRAALAGVGNAPTWRATTPLMRRPCLDFNGTTNYLEVFAADGTTPIEPQALITATAFTLAAVVYVEAAVGTNAVAPFNDGILANSQGTFGMHVRNNGGSYSAQFFNYDGAHQVIDLPLTLNISNLLMCRHHNGVLYASINGGRESSVGSGSTVAMDGWAYLGANYNSDAKFNGRIGELAIWKSGARSITDAAVRYFKSKWHLVSAPMVTAVHVRTDHNEYAQPTVAKPAYLASATDPTYGSIVTRITGDDGVAIPVVGGTWGDVTRHNYSKDPVWSCDETLMVLKRVTGATGHLILDGFTYAPLWLRTPPAGTAETRWHPTVVDTMVYVTSTATVGHWNVRANTTSVKFSTSGYTGCTMGQYEGNLSLDGRYVVIAGTRTSDSKLVCFAVDITNGTKESDIDLVAQGVISSDNMSISPLGTYIIVNGRLTGSASVSGGYDSLKLFTRAGTATGQNWLEYGYPSHFDTGVDVSGNEVAFGVDKVNANEGKVVMRRMSDGVITVLNTGGYAQHASGRNTQRPNWGYISHPYNGPSYPPYRLELMAVKLATGLQVERYGFIHTTNEADYECQPHAVPSPTGTRICFASSWENVSTRPVQAYVMDMRHQSMG